MPKNKQINHKGFTLLEILLVIGIIGILAAIVIIAINPGRSLAKSRDLQRKVGITEINKGLNQYYIDNGRYPSSIGSTGVKSICNTGANTTSSGIDCMGMADLSVLVPTYLPFIPVDPTGVGYKVGVSRSRSIILIATKTEINPTPIAIGTTTSPVDTSLTLSAGSGTPSDPYQISNWNQLNLIRGALLDSAYILMNDLNSTTQGYSGIGDNWTPIADGYNGSFGGNFNGNGNTISDVIINLPSTNYVGFFGALWSGGSISNLRLTNISVTGNQFVGGLVGYDIGGSISNCATQGTVSGTYAVGGLIGRHNGGTVSSSFSSANVVGRNGPPTSYLGGFVGLNYGTNPSILNCYSTGSVTAYDASKNGVGGFSNGFDSNNSISYSYSTGLVSGTPSAGGFVGNDPGTVISSFWDQTTSGQPSSSKGTGTTTAGMKTASLYSAWDTGIWNITDGSYPTLK